MGITSEPDFYKSVSRAKIKSIHTAACVACFHICSHCALIWNQRECFEFEQKHINDVWIIYREFFTLGNQQLWNQAQGHGARQEDSSRLLHSSAPSQTDKVPPQITSPWLHDQWICYLRRSKWWKNQVLINICIWLPYTCSIAHKE